MLLIESSTNQKYRATISLVEKHDYKKITKARYFFDWKKEHKNQIYKIEVEGTDDILGLISVLYIPKECRIHINLLTVSKENKGKNKKYHNIIGNLITYISKIALREYGELACVSLKPKSNIAQHYIDTYGMNITGNLLSVELKEILHLIAKYDINE